MPKILAQNEKDTLGVLVAVADLRTVVVEKQPDYGVLNEWPKNRDAATRAMLGRLGYGYSRPKRGGGPILWKNTDVLTRMKSKRLALPGFVGRIPGRRSWLGTSWLTEAFFASGRVVLGFHLTAEVQDVRGGGGYKNDLRHKPRVWRHKHEKRSLGRRARALTRRGRAVYPAGDTNYSDMPLGGFHGCWEGHGGGDLGGRAVTIVYSTRKPAVAPETVKTHSDHLAVVVTY